MTQSDNTKRGRFIDPFILYSSLSVTVALHSIDSSHGLRPGELCPHCVHSEDYSVNLSLKNTFCHTSLLFPVWCTNKRETEVDRFIRFMALFFFD